MEDHVKRELGCEEGEEPLRGVHMSLQTHIQEMVVQVWYIFLFQTEKNPMSGRHNKVKEMTKSSSRLVSKYTFFLSTVKRSTAVVYIPKKV